MHADAPRLRENMQSCCSCRPTKIVLTAKTLLSSPSEMQLAGQLGKGGIADCKKPASRSCLFKLGMRIRHDACFLQSKLPTRPLVLATSVAPRSRFADMDQAGLQVFCSQQFQLVCILVDSSPRTASFSVAKEAHLHYSCRQHCLMLHFAQVCVVRFMVEAEESILFFAC